MDPLSITASAIAVITFALQAVQLVNDDIRNIRNAPNNLQDAGADLDALEPLLRLLKNAAEKDKEQLAHHRMILAAVENCSENCKSFRQQLRLWLRSDSDGRFTLINRVKVGLLGQDQVKEFRSKLGDCKGTLTLILVAARFIEPPHDDKIAALIERSEQQLSAKLTGLASAIQERDERPKNDQGLGSVVRTEYNQIQEQLAVLSAGIRQFEIHKNTNREADLNFEDLRRHLSDLSKMSEEFKQTLANLPGRTASVKDVARLADHVLLTIPSTDRETLIEKVGLPVDKSCSWLFRENFFHGWIRAEPAFVWLCGNSGRGKTMLCLSLTTELHRYTKGLGVHLIYYFCDRQDEKRNTAAAILRSLLWQLTQIPQLADCIAKHLAEHKLPLLSEHDALWRLFAALMLDEACGQVYCVLDGLDELEDDAELWLANKLLSLFSPGAREPHLNVLRLFLVSRSIPGFRLRGQSVRFDLDTDLKDQVDAGIEEVVNAALSTVPDWANFSEEYRQKVRQEVMLKTKGSFVPVKIIMNAILFDRPFSGLLETIQALPTGLDALYGSTLLGIEKKQQYETPEVLRWVAMSFRPLSLTELANAVGGNLDESDIRATVQRCGALLNIHGNTVVFSHSSVRDFLLQTTNDYTAALQPFDAAQKEIVSQFHIDPQEAHLEIALKCLDIIKESHLQHRALDAKDEWEGVPLLQYAVLYWPHHARGSGDYGKEMFGSTSFVLASAPVLGQNWWRTYIHHRPGQEWEQGEKLSPLHIACRFGITEWARTLLSEAGPQVVEKIIDAYDVNGVTPLAWAVIGGHASVVKLLIDSGANVEALTALYSREGMGRLSSQTIRSYVREVQVGDGMWSGRHTSLYRAAYKGHVSVARLLLDHGANVHAHGWARSSPMHAVCIGGSVEVMHLLLERGGDIDVNAEIKNSHTMPLHHAVENGHRELARILLEHGADIRKRQRYSSAAVLHFAAVKDPDPATVELLLSHGAEVNVRDSHNRQPLHCFAMRHSKPAAVKLLLDNGASVNGLNGLRRTALDLAIECLCDRCRETTQILLVYGATLKSPTKTGRRNHPELFQSGDHLEPLAQTHTSGSNIILSSDDEPHDGDQQAASSLMEDTSSLVQSFSFSLNNLDISSGTEATSSFADEVESGEVVVDGQNARGAKESTATPWNKFSRLINVRRKRSESLI